MLGQTLLLKEAFLASVNDYLAEPVIRRYWWALGAVNAALWLLAWLVWRGLHQDLAILHYNIIFGIDYLAPRGQIYFLPFIATILSFVNGWLSLGLCAKNAYLSRLLLAAALAAGLIVGLALYSIYLVNFVKIF